MINVEQMSLILDALPDPAFIFSKTGKYLGVFGGRDKRYYHDGSGLVGRYIAELIKPEKANWFLAQIDLALQSRQLLIAEYELSNRDVRGLPDEGPEQPIWFEGRIQALNFLVEAEEVVLWVATNISERHQLEIRLREIGDTDQLTGLFNRRKLQHDLSQHYAAYVQQAVPTALLMFDLDNLKKINDSNGHHVGDEAIQLVARICQSALRKTDCACRFGGDEFVIALPNTEYAQALEIAKRLHDRFRQELSQFSVDGIAITASMGVTSIGPKDCTYEDSIIRADQALYQAKNSGRDRIVTA